VLVPASDGALLFPFRKDSTSMAFASFTTESMSFRCRSSLGGPLRRAAQRASRGSGGQRLIAASPRLPRSSAPILVVVDFVGVGNDLERHDGVVAWDMLLLLRLAVDAVSFHPAWYVKDPSSLSAAGSFEQSRGNGSPSQRRWAGVESPRPYFGSLPMSDGPFCLPPPAGNPTKRMLAASVRLALGGGGIQFPVSTWVVADWQAVSSSSRADVTLFGVIFCNRDEKIAFTGAGIGGGFGIRTYKRSAISGE